MSVILEKWIENPQKPSLWECFFGNPKWSKKIEEEVSDGDIERLLILTLFGFTVPTRLNCAKIMQEIHSTRGS